MRPFKTANVVIISAAAVFVVAIVAVCAMTANGAADAHRVQMVRACVAAGNQWVSGNCVHTTASR